MDDSAKLDYAKTYLRRTKTLAELKALSLTVATALLSNQGKVMVTSANFEGGSSSGQVEWETVLTGMACEAVIAELEPTAPAQRRPLGDIVAIR